MHGSGAASSAAAEVAAAAAAVAKAWRLSSMGISMTRDMILDLVELTSPTRLERDSLGPRGVSGVAAACQQVGRRRLHGHDRVDSQPLGRYAYLRKLDTSEECGVGSEVNG